MKLRILALAGCFGLLIQSVNAQAPQSGSTPNPVSPNAQPSESLPQNAPPPTAVVKPIPPGGVQIVTRAPDPGKWDAVVDPKTGTRTFACKPLACADVSRVVISFSRSPTRSPDPDALEKFAKVDLPKSIAAGNAAQSIMSDGANKLETLSGKTAKLKNYPAVLNETKMTMGKKVVFIETAIIFAGPSMMKFTSLSPNQHLAQKSLNEFVETTVIREGPPVPPGGQPGQPLTPAVAPGDKPESL